MTETRPSQPVGVPPPTHADLGPAMALFRRERFAEAFASLQALPEAAGSNDPDVLLLRAILQTHTGDLSGAERSCRDLLRIDEMSAAAHYVLALCQEALGDARSAAEHDRIASYLDPTFAMSWLHLGLLAKREGDAQLVRSAIGRGLVLLEREDTARILLFGGGFGRETLVELCRRHLAAAGEP